MQLTVADATAKSLFLVGRAVVGVSLGSLALGALHARLSRTERQRVDFHPIRSPLVAAAKPALVLLPYYGVARIATVLSALVQVVAIRMRPEFDAFMRGHSEAALEVIQWVTQLLQDSCELFLILAVAWSLKRCKDRAVSALQLRVQQKADTAGGNDSLTRLLDGASGGVTWIIWIVAGFVALQAYGVDASPLLASLGASSIVLGLAAQKVLANVIAGLSLFASSAFAVGDHVKLVSSGGNVVVEGTIQVIAPARTVIRASDDGALIYVNNADITSMIVRNVSQAAVASAL